MPLPLSTSTCFHGLYQPATPTPQVPSEHQFVWVQYRARCRVSFSHGFQCNFTRGFSTPKGRLSEYPTLANGSLSVPAAAVRSCPMSLECNSSSISLIPPSST
eukprot:Sspe_Gene.31394::Locus_15496_Transcript_2_3_Confidence_0.400_Length_3127::g.31394::m.31394